MNSVHLSDLVCETSTNYSLDVGARVTEDVIVATNTTNNPEIVQLIMEHAV